MIHFNLKYYMVVLISGPIFQDSISLVISNLIIDRICLVNLFLN